MRPRIISAACWTTVTTDDAPRQQSVQDIVAWARIAGSSPLGAKLVPGASDAERQTLRALGGVARALLGSAAQSDQWPAELAGWWGDAPEPPEHLITDLRRDLAANPQTLLARMYEMAVVSPHRRALGTFFTPSEIVDRMLARAEATAGVPTSVVDMGAGVGVFTAAAMRRWPEADVWAVDVNPVTLGLLAVLTHLSGDGLQRKSRLRLVLDDFARWQHDVESLGSPRLLIGNPPFTRAQLLSREDRAWLSAQAGDICGSRAPLSTWLLALSLKRLDESDALCLLLPSHWLESAYGDGVRRRLWDEARRRVEITSYGPDLFDGARVDAVVLLVGPRTGSQQPLVARPAPECPGHEVVRGVPCPPTFRALILPSGETAGASGDEASHTLLRDIATVRRGVATGANAFFVISEETRAEWGLPRRLVVPVARHLRAFGDVITRDSFENAKDDERCWLLRLAPADASLVSVDRYLAHGKKLGVHFGELCSRRKYWYDFRDDLVIPDVIIGPMTRARFRIVVNQHGAAITNNLYGFRWNSKVSTRERTRVVTWLRSDAGQETLRAAARRQAHGLFKIEPGALRCLRVSPST